MNIKDDLFVESMARELPSQSNRSAATAGGNSADPASSRSLFEAVFNDTRAAAAPQEVLAAGAVPESRPQLSSDYMGTLPGLMMAGEVSTLMGLHMSRRNRVKDSYPET